MYSYVSSSSSSPTSSPPSFSSSSSPSFSSFPFSRSTKGQSTASLPSHQHEPTNPSATMIIRPQPPTSSSSSSSSSFFSTTNSSNTTNSNSDSNTSSKYSTSPSFPQATTPPDLLHLHHPTLSTSQSIQQLDSPSTSPSNTDHHMMHPDPTSSSNTDTSTTTSTGTSTGSRHQRYHTRRRLQVRRAQSHHRQRKAEYIKRLERELVSIRGMIEEAQGDMERLRGENEILELSLDAVGQGT